MHSAPALTYPVGRSRFHGWLLGLTCIFGGGAGLFWNYQVDPSAWRQGLYAATLLGLAWVAVQAWRHSSCGSLNWDGQAWSWTDDTTALRGWVTVHLDLQFCLLLCLRTEQGRRLWIWPERGRDAARWSALRRAAFFHGAAGQAPDAATDAQRAQVGS